MKGKEAAMSWSRRFDEPIILPDGKKLLTLKDAIAKGRTRNETGSSRCPLCHRGRLEQRPDDVRADEHDAGDQPT
jgi:hypothetical protein